MTRFAFWLLLAVLLITLADMTVFEDGSFTGCLPWAVCVIGG